MANLRLADVVDAPEALFQVVCVLRQVVVHHQVRLLQVHTFARRVGGEQDTSVLFVAEQLLHLAPILAVDYTVNHHDGFMLAQKSPNPVGQIVQRVTVLGKVD